MNNSMVCPSEGSCSGPLFQQDNGLDTLVHMVANPSIGMKPPSDVELAVKAPLNEDHRTAEKDEAWAKHLPTLRRLYVDDGMKLKLVMEYMETEHNFKASPKMYKQRFRKWGFKKNIRLRDADAEINYYMLKDTRGEGKSTALPNSTVQLANGQVVDLERLVTHLRRKMLYRKHAQKTIALTSINPPEQFYMCEAVLNDTRAYLRGLYEEAFTYVEEVDFIRVTQPATLRWNRFFYRCRGALEHPSRFSQALVLMRQAPEELRQLLESEPASVLNLLFKFIVHVARCLRNIDDPDDRKQFSVVVHALIGYAASVVVPLRGQHHPLSQMLRTLARVDDAQMHPLALKAWKLSCHVWDDISTSTQSHQDPVLVGTPLPRGCASTVSDWLGFLAVAPDEVPPDVEYNIDLILQALRRVFGEERARRVDEMWAVGGGLVAKSSVGEDEDVPGVIRRVGLVEDQVHDMFRSVVGHDFEWGVPKILVLRSFDDARKVLQSAEMMEQWWWSQGEYKRAEAAALWIGELSGDT